MAVKKTTKSAPKKEAAAPKKAATVKKTEVKKEAAPKKAASAAKKAPKPKAAADAAAKPKAAAPAKPKAAPKKKASAPKITSAQADLLKKIGGAGETGYLGDKKAEVRTLEALRERKLVKRGAKDKASGNFHYTITSTGKKLVESAAPPAAPTTTGNA